MFCVSFLAGAAVAEECRSHVDKHGILQKAKKVYVSSAGNLSFQKIMHVVFPEFIPKSKCQSNHIKILYILFKCLSYLFICPFKSTQEEKNT